MHHRDCRTALILSVFATGTSIIVFLQGDYARTRIPELRTKHVECSQLDIVGADGKVVGTFKSLPNQGSEIRLFGSPQSNGLYLRVDSVGATVTLEGPGSQSPLAMLMADRTSSSMWLNDANGKTRIRADVGSGTSRIVIQDDTNRPVAALPALQGE